MTLFQNEVEIGNNTIFRHFDQFTQLFSKLAMEMK